MKECIIPEPALRDEDSVEMIRVWVAEQGLHCTINIGMYEKHAAPEEVAWGIILADVARHVANAISDGYGRNSDDALRQVRQSFLDELDGPTSDVKGGFAPSRH